MDGCREGEGGREGERDRKRAIVKEQEGDVKEQGRDEFQACQPALATERARKSERERARGEEGGGRADGREGEGEGGPSGRRCLL